MAFVAFAVFVTFVACDDFKRGRHSYEKMGMTFLRNVDRLKK